MDNLKKIILMIIVLISIIGFGCNEEEFLNETPVSSLTNKNFFESSADFEQGVNGCYQSLMNIFGPSGRPYGLWAMEEMRSDNTTFQRGPNNSLSPLWNLCEFQMDYGSRITTDLWNYSYRGIGKCNSLLRNIEDKEVNNKVRYQAETKFLRALYYHYMVGYFGDIPLVTTVIDSYEDAFENDIRVPESQVYEQILSDLNDAKQNLPKSYSSSDAGRATEGAARTLLAKVLMRLGRYGDAASELEAVMSSGQYSLLDDYSSVFNINNENNEEIVFSVQYIEGPYGLYNSYQYFFLPYQVDPEYLSGFNPNSGHCGENLPTRDLINSFEEGDVRQAMIDTSFTHEFGYYHGQIVPFTRKYMHPGHSEERNTGANFKVLRYSHVLLMLAECYLREGGGDPVPLVNQVRERSGLDALNDVTLDDILHERRIEFHCEADRWGTLVRFHKEGDIDVVELMQAHGEEERERPAIKGTAFSKIKLLYPIPTSVIELNSQIEQNPEYK
jgi:hypothetical protein